MCLQEIISMIDRPIMIYKDLTCKPLYIFTEFLQCPLQTSIYFHVTLIISEKPKTVNNFWVDSSWAMVVIRSWNTICFHLLTNHRKHGFWLNNLGSMGIESVSFLLPATEVPKFITGCIFHKELAFSCSIGLVKNFEIGKVRLTRHF